MADVIQVAIPQRGSGTDAVRQVVAVAISRLIQAQPSRLTDQDVIDGLLAEAALRSELCHDIRPDTERMWAARCPLPHSGAAAS